MTVAQGDPMRPEQLFRLERYLQISFKRQHLVKPALGGERQRQGLTQHIAFADLKHGRLPGRTGYVGGPASRERETAERRFPALPPEIDDARLGAVAERSSRADHQRIAAAAAGAAPLFGKELGKLPEPPTKELAKHVPKPIPGFAPNRRTGMLKSR